MNRANTTTWITLMLMTVASYSISGGHVAAWTFLVIAGVKFSLVAWQFMELRCANVLWQISVGGLLALILVVAAVVR